TSPHKDAFAAMGFPGCVTCHSNHEIKHPTDEMIGTGPNAVCMKCHTEGDTGSLQAEAMHAQLTNVASAIAAWKSCSAEPNGRAWKSASPSCRRHKHAMHC